MVCHLDKIPCFDDTFVGHANWFPVTLEGHAGWGDHGPDDDYTFTFMFDGAQCDKDNNQFAGNQLSVNARCGLHVEFNSDETINNYTQVDEWKTLHNSVDCLEGNGIQGQLPSVLMRRAVKPAAPTNSPNCSRRLP